MNPNKFLTLLMGQCWHSAEKTPEGYRCKSCGTFMLHHRKDGWEPYNFDHLSNPLSIVRFMEKEMPGVLDNYLHWCFQRPRTSSLSEDIFFILDLNNLVAYLVQNPSWAETPCPNSSAHCKDYCDGSPCNGSGLIVHPALRYARDNKEEG